MAILNRQDYQDILQVVYLCNSSLEPKGLREEILQSLQKLFNTDGLGFFPATRDLKGLELANLISLNLDEHFNTIYAQHYWRYDPHLQKALHSKSIVFKSDDILPRAQWLRLPYYNEFLRPQNKKQELEICLRSGDKLFGMVSLLRSRRQPNFNENDVIKAKVLAPHITNALRNAIVFSNIENERKLLRTGNEFLPYGVILLDFELRPIYFNSEAKRICRTISYNNVEPANGIKSEELSVPSEIIQDCLILKEQLRSGNQIDLVKHQRIISTEHNQTFYIECFYILEHSQLSSTNCFLVLLEGPSEIYRVNKDLIKSKYNLTKKEMDIIHCVTGGQTNSEIAENLFISRLTVETHLRHIFEKTGVRNRTELAGLMQSAGKF